VDLFGSIEPLTDAGSFSPAVGSRCLLQKPQGFVSSQGMGPANFLLYNPLMPVKCSLETFLEISPPPFSSGKGAFQFHIAYADCFAAALAKMMDAEVVTGDKDFKVLEGQIGIAWL